MYNALNRTIDATYAGITLFILGAGIIETLYGVFVHQPDMMLAGAAMVICGNYLVETAPS